MRQVFGLFSFLLVSMIGYSICAKAADLTMGIPSQTDQATGAWIKAFLEEKELFEVGVNIKAIPYGSPRQAARDLIGGNIDIALISIDVIETLDPNRVKAPQFAAILTQPFQFEETQEVFEIQQSPLGDAVLADLNQTGLIAVGYWNRGRTNILSTRPVRTAADLKGLKIRSPRRREGDQVLLALGASPVRLALAEVQQALLRGVIDAAEISSSTSIDLVQRVGEGGGLIPGYRPLVGVLAANGGSWLRLTEREKSTMVKVTRTATEKGNAEAVQVERQLKNVAEKYGVSLTSFGEADRKALSNASQDAWSRYRKGRAVALVGELNEMKRLVAAAKKSPPVKKVGPPAPKNSPPVLFVTNRRDEGGDELEDRFGSRQKGAPLTCGQLGYSPAAAREIGDGFDGELELTSDGTFTGEGNCLDIIGARVAKYGLSDVLIFVHGFNNTFEEAVRRAITTAIDIAYDGLVVVWSWPSEGHVVTYARDEESVRFSRPYLISFSKKLVSRPEIKKADFLFHSLGNRLGLWMAEALSVTPGLLPSLGTFIFAAPDEARDIFGDSIDRTPDLKSQRTLYAAKCDRPLWISQIIHFGARAGTGGHKNILLNAGMESVDVTEVEASCWWTYLSPITSVLPISHSYVFDTPEVINDLKLVLKEGRAAAGRNVSERFRDGSPYKVVNED